VVSRAFSVLCTYSKFRHHPHPQATYVPNFVSVAASIAELAHGEQEALLLQRNRVTRKTAWHARYYHIYSLRGCHLEKYFTFEKIVDITSHVHISIMSKHIVDNTHCMTTPAPGVPEISYLMWDKKGFTQQKWPSRSQYATGNDSIR